MLPVLLLAALWIPAALGLGSVLRLGRLGEMDAAVHGMAGLGVIAVAGTAVHFVAPVGPVLAWPLLAGGLALFLRQWRAGRWRPGAADLALIAAALLVASALAQAPDVHYDTGLYRLPMLRWMTQEPIAPGLANLHGRFGFNSSWTLVAASMVLVPGQPWNAVVLNALPLVFGGAAVRAAARAFLAGDRSLPTTFLLAGALPAALTLRDVGGLNADHPVAMLAYLAVALWLRAFLSEERSPADAGAALFLSAFAATVKLSALPVLAASGAALLLLRSRSTVVRAMPAFAGAALLALWLARGVLLSGCLAYPAAATCFTSLPWAVPARAALRMAHVIGEWARVPGVPVPAEPRPEWLGQWVEGYRPFLLALGGALLAGALFALGRADRQTRRVFLAAWGASLAGAVFWFVEAPDYRLGLPVLLPLVLLPWAYGLSWRSLGVPSRRSVVALLGSAVLALAAALVARRADQADDPWRWLHPPAFPRPPTKKHVTSHGLVVHVPADGDQCWLAPRPCAPRFDPGLGRSGNLFRTPTTSPTR